MTIPRLAPRIGPDSEHFWRGGAEGQLLVLRCATCGRYAHPPVPVCPECLSPGLRPESVSGRGTVFSYTVNRHSMRGEPVDPYVIALVELVEQPGLRLTTNIIDCAIERVAVGMEVAVRFEQLGEAYLPLFAPVAPGEGSRTA